MENLGTRGDLGACPIKTLHVVDGKFVASCDGVRRRKRVWILETGVDPRNGSCPCKQTVDRGLHKLACTPN
jgi:hypothetical protein